MNRLQSTIVKSARKATRKAAPGVEKLRKLYPLTLTGTILSGSMFWLLGYSYATENPYGYLLACTGLGIILILAVLARIQGMRLNLHEAVWNTTHTISSAGGRGRTAIPHTLEVNGFSTFPFFRLHVQVSGILKNRNCSVMYIYRDFSGYVSGGEGVIDTSLAVPLSGTLHASARIVVKDFLGLTRGEAVEVHKRQLAVLPALLDKNVQYQSATQGAEEQTKMKSSDIERYYMRDYVPGDRFRDINWKASSRGEKLFTRISPVAEEKTRTVSIWVRLYRPHSWSSVEQTLHADFLKSWIMTFLSAVRQEHSDYTFRIFAAGEEYYLEAEDDFTSFAGVLSDLPWKKAGNPAGELPEQAKTEGNMYLFAPYFDPGLKTLDHFFPKITFHRHITFPPPPKTADTSSYSGEAIKTPLLPGLTGRDIPLPTILDPRQLFSRKPGDHRYLLKKPGTGIILVPALTADT